MSQVQITTSNTRELELARELENIKFALDKAAVVTVSDNGIGFDEKCLDRIFKIFQKLHGRSEYEGTGTDLAICRRIAERHMGSLTATNSPGKGASFIVSLPVSQTKEGDLLYE